MNTQSPSYKVAFPKVLWLFFPIAVFIYPFVLKALGYDREDGPFHEYAFIENATWVFLAIAIWYGIRLVFNVGNYRQKIWFILLSLGAFYFMGEELSWGQQFFHWATPEGLSNLNAQHETNLHNLQGIYYLLFNKIPKRTLLTLCVICGFLVPLYLTARRVKFDSGSINHWIWPSYTCSIAGICAYLVSVPAKIATHTHTSLPVFLNIDYEEVKECFMAMFILFYMITMWKYFMQVKAEPADNLAPGIDTASGTWEAHGIPES